MNSNKRRYGAMIGAAVGDAIGVTYEFLPPFLIPQPPYEMIGGGPFELVPGGASDDTDLFFCVLKGVHSAQ